MIIKRFIPLFLFIPFLLYADETSDLPNITKKILKENSKYLVNIFINRKKESEVSQPSSRIRIPTRYPEYFKRPEGSVSGVIIDKNGYIITSYFNIESEEDNPVESVKVKLQNGREYDAKILGWHEDLDVALLKIDSDNLSFLEIKETSQPKVGDFVFSIGGNPNMSETTITFGIVSAVNQLDSNILQIDAELNYGSTGGPIFDKNGNFIGIATNIHNTAMWGQNSGVGFVTPNYKIIDILQKLKDGEKIKKPDIPFLGVRWDEESEGVIGAKILSVVKDTPAEKAGIKPGDIIIKFNDTPIQNWNQFRSEIKKCKVGDKVTIIVSREDEEIKLEATLIKRPPNIR